MARQNDDPDLRPLGRNPENNDPDLRPLGPSPSTGMRPLNKPTLKRPEPTPDDTPWYENILTVPNALRIGLPLLGTALAPETMGLSALAVPFLAGAVGDIGARAYEGRDFSLPSAVLEGGINSVIPGFGELPGKGAGLKAIGEYALKQAGQGAALGAASSVPRHIIDEGNLFHPSKWNLPSRGDVASQTLGGAVVGGALGAAHGGLNVAYRGALDKYFPVDPNTPGYKQGDLFEGHEVPPQQEQLIPHPVNRFDELSDLGVRSSEQQTELDALREYLGGNKVPSGVRPGIDPFTKKFRKITGEPVQQDLPLTPPIDEGGQGTLFDLSPNQPPTHINITGPNIIPDESPTIDLTEDPLAALDLEGVSALTGERVRQLFGMEPREAIAKGLITQGENGYHITPQATGRTSNARTRAEVPQIQEPPPASAVGMPIKNERATPSLIENLKQNGWILDRVDDTNHWFKRLVKDETGAVDISWLRNKLLRILGREPTQPELERAAFEEEKEGPKVGEETGRVADFYDESKFTNEELLQYLNSPTVTENPQLKKQVEDLLRKRGIVPNPEDAPPLPTGGSVYRGWDFDTPAPTPTEPLSVTPWGSFADQVTPPEGPRPHSVVPGVDQARPLGEGQLDIPLMGQGRMTPPVNEGVMSPAEVAALRMKSRYEQQPEQMGFGDELGDSLINDYLKNEDVVLPESRDLNGNSPKRRVWSDLLKRFIDDETGSVDIGALHEWMRNRFRNREGREPNPEELGDEVESIKRLGGPTEFDKPTTQERLDVESTEFERPYDPFVENYPSKTTAQYREERINKITELKSKLAEAGNRGDAFEARMIRRRIDDLRTIGSALDSGPINRSEEVLAKAKKAEADGDTEAAAKYNEKADRLAKEEAGQLKFRVLSDKARKLGIEITPEKLKEIEASLNPRDYADDISHEYAREMLDHTPDGPPGLTVELRDYSPTEGPEREWRIIYRDSQGHAIARATTAWDGWRGRSTVDSLTADKDSGLFGRGLLAVGKKLIELDALRPSGSYSPHTAALIRRLIDFIKDEQGSVNISAMGEAWDKIRGFLGLGGTSKALSEDMGKIEDRGAPDIAYRDLIHPDDQTPLQEGESWKSRASDLLKRLVSEERGSVPLSGDEEGSAWKKFKEGSGWGSGVLPKPNAPKPVKGEVNYFKEAFIKLPSNATTMLDLSAPGRQGITMAMTPEFWRAMIPSLKAMNYDKFKEIQAELMNTPIMKRGIDPVTGKETKSIGDRIGTKLFAPASEPGEHAEQIASKWLENIPLAGYPIRATNRAYITFLNHLNVNRTQKLFDLARDMSLRGIETGETAMPGLLGGIHLPGGENIGLTQKVNLEEAMNMNPYHNLVLGKEIAEFVNAATGHASPTNTLERAVARMGPVLFSPGLLNSRIRVLNPYTYMMASPMVRQQYLKAAMSAFSAWAVSSLLIKNAAGSDAEIGDDPTSADFGKIRVGNAHLDLGGGFLQFAVALARLWNEGSTSSSSGIFHPFGEGYQAQTQENMMQRFLVNKLNPISKFVYDVANATHYNPVHMGDRAIQMAIPLFYQDMWELYQANPSLFPLGAGVSLFGGGSQIYDKGESVGKFLDENNDWIYEGQGLSPKNWFGNQ